MKEKKKIFFNTVNAAKYIGYSPKTLERLRSQGDDGPKYYKSQGLRGRVRYLKEDLDAWLLARSSAYIKNSAAQETRDAEH